MGRFCVCLFVCLSTHSPLKTIEPGLRPSQPGLSPSQPVLKPEAWLASCMDLMPGRLGLRPGWLGLSPGWLGLRPGRIAQSGGRTHRQIDKWTSKQTYRKSLHSTELCPLSGPLPQKENKRKKKVELQKGPLTAKFGPDL